jgi:pimeloyl-ACP methyl ester carboxylesterase
MRLTHGRVELELHALRDGHGLPLLLLHALFGSSADWNELPPLWPGPVFALDFSGHGRSDPVIGGGYSPELLLADADAAVAHLGTVAIMGAGIGAYVALLLAGTRAAAVRGALLLPGAGLAGDGPLPDFHGSRLPLDVPGGNEPAAGEHDPLVRALNRDARPPEYAALFARAACRLLFVEIDSPPPWWEAAQRVPGAERVPADLPRAVARLAAVSA